MPKAMYSRFGKRIMIEQAVGNFLKVKKKLLGADNFNLTLRGKSNLEVNLKSVISKIWGHMQGNKDLTSFLPKSTTQIHSWPLVPNHKILLTFSQIILEYKKYILFLYRFMFSSFVYLKSNAVVFQKLLSQIKYNFFFKYIWITL